MGLTLSVEDIPLLREPIDRALKEGRKEGKIEGRVEGKLDAIRKILELRFPDQISDDLMVDLHALEVEALDDVLGRSLTADTAEDAVGHQHASRFSRR